MAFSTNHHAQLRLVTPITLGDVITVNTVATFYDGDEEKTEVIYPNEDIIGIALQDLSKTRKSLDIVGDYDGPRFLIENERIATKYLELKNRGVKIRQITEITKDNIPYCKRVMEFSELRHLVGVKGTYGINDTRTFGSIILDQESKRPLHFVHSNVKALVEQEKFVFETLWDKAIPAEHRIREIEEGIKPEIIETLREPVEIQKRAFELINSAKDEMLIIFSTSNAFRRQKKAGTIDLLLKTAISNHVKVRIMSPFDDYVKNLDDKIKKESKGKIEIRNIEEPLQTKVSVLIVDRTSMLTAELKSDSKETSLEAIGLATYSNSKATVLSYASIFESLWNQTELYEHIRYLYEQLKSHDKMKQEFIDIAAHELRTPIQPILGLAQVLKDKISDSAETKLLDTILRNARRLEQLQEAMLDVTRIESGSMKIYKESFNLNELIFRVIEDFRTQLKDDSRIRLNYRSDGDIWINVDGNRIIQVISNLLTNAIKFTKDGTIWVRLRIRKSKKMKDHDEILVSVRDEGSGIDPSIMPRLFTKFVSKSEKGTGLGLFISKSIIEAHGGEIWAKNNRRNGRRRGGSGATFSFVLPVKSPDDDLD